VGAAVDPRKKCCSWRTWYPRNFPRARHLRSTPLHSTLTRIRIRHPPQLHIVHLPTHARWCCKIRRSPPLCFDILTKRSHCRRQLPHRHRHQRRFLLYHGSIYFLTNIVSYGCASFPPNLPGGTGLHSPLGTSRTSSLLRCMSY